MVGKVVLMFFQVVWLLVYSEFMSIKSNGVIIILVLGDFDLDVYVFYFFLVC